MNDTTHTISIRVRDNQYAMIEAEAASKGLTPSQLVKMRVFDALNKHTSTGAMRRLAEIEAMFKSEIEALKTEFEMRLREAGVSNTQLHDSEETSTV